MACPGRDTDGIACVQLKEFTVEGDGHIALLHIGGLFAHMGAVLIRSDGLGRNLHQHKFDAGFGVGREQVVGYLTVPVADGAVFAFADDEFLLGVAVLLEENIEREIQRLGQRFQGVDGRIDSIVFDLADHGGGDACLFRQSAETQPPLGPVFLNLLSDVQIDHNMFLTVVFAAAAPAEGHTPQYYHYSMFGREDQVAKR